MNAPENEARRYLSEAEELAGRGPGAERRQVEQVGVVGAGTMGAGIASAFLQAGFPVTLVEQSDDALAAGLRRVREIQDKAVARGKADRTEADRRLAALAPTTEAAELAGCDLVLEAVFEDMDVKRELLARLGSLVEPGAILASNTSYLDLDVLAEATGRPGDVVGLHFFSPAHVMRLLEVVRGEKTADDTLATALWLGRKLGKLPVVARVCDGFIGNRIYSVYRTECEFMLEEGALPEQVDAALEEFGFAMGPFAVGDLSGLDIAWANRKRLAATREPGERVPGVLDRLCEHGRLGRKAGAGYYRYPEGARRGEVDEVANELVREVSAEKGFTRREFTAEEIVERALGAIVEESGRVLDDGIAERASDIDLVLVNGYGFPADRGGPLYWSSRRG